MTLLNLGEFTILVYQYMLTRERRAIIILLLMSYYFIITITFIYRNRIVTRKFIYHFNRYL